MIMRILNIKNSLSAAVAAAAFIAASGASAHGDEDPAAKAKSYDASKVEPDVMKRHQLVWDMIKIHVSDGPFMMGSVANYPQVMVIKTDLKNVPRKENLAQGGMVNPWIHPTPAVYDPECYFWDNPDAHT